MRHFRSRSDFGTNTPQIAGARHKQALSKIIVFTIRQRKIIRPQTTRINIICILPPFTSKIITSVLMPTVNNTNLDFTPCFWLILRYAHGLYDKVLSRSRALSYPKNTTEKPYKTRYSSEKIFSYSLNCRFFNDIII